jgi:hypothetical protein
MVIEPAHGVLDSHMQIPEGVSGRYQNLSPDWWRESDKFHPDFKQVTPLVDYRVKHRADVNFRLIEVPPDYRLLHLSYSSPSVRYRQIGQVNIN